MLGTMSLAGVNDDEAFEPVRDSLLNRFQRWLGHERQMSHDQAAEVAADAGLALDWKWNYGDGDVASWRAGDISEFLLDWCPRKLSASPEEALSIPSALA